MKISLQQQRLLLQLLRSSVSSARSVHRSKTALANGSACTWRSSRIVVRGFGSGSEKATTTNTDAVEGKGSSDGSEQSFHSDLQLTDSISQEMLGDAEEQKLGHIDLSEKVISPREFDRLPPKCTACGAVFHNIHEEIAGYLKKEKLELISGSYNKHSFLSIPGEKQIVCQPCFNLRHHNVKVARMQDRHSVVSQLSHMHQTRALVLYVVDLFDMYGTLVPDLSNFIGARKHIILVGNKLDKFPTGTYTTGGKHLNFLKEQLLESAREFSHTDLSIKDTCLVSAVHGYGIEELITKIIKHRENRSHIYIVGGNNSGKSTLFNVLQNFLNLLTKKRALPPQAIVHHTPGSTYSLIRGPIGKGSLQGLRRLFLKPPPPKEDKIDETQLALSDELIAELGINVPGRKTKDTEIIRVQSKESERSFQQMFELVGSEDISKRLFMYDTPGIPNSEQLLQFLTDKEIQHLNQTLWIVPETRLLRPGQSLLIGGMIRIDFEKISRPSKEDISVFEDVPKASQSIFFTLFFPRMVPRHITSSERVEILYKQHLGGDLLKIPFGDEERLKSFPKLEPLEYTIVGCGWDRGVKDVVFNGLGWISVTAGHLSHVKIKVHTPLGIGQYLRQNPLLPEAIKRRGERGAMYLGKPNKQIYQSTRKKNPALVEHMKERNENTKALMGLVAEKRRHDKRYIKHRQQELRLEQGVVLGAFKRIGKLEKLLEMKHQSLLPAGEEENHSNDNSP